MSIVNSWGGIKRYLQIEIPEVYETLNSPANLLYITDIESQIGFQLPEDLKKLYLINNGQYAETKIIGGPFLGLKFLDLSQIVTNYKYWGSLVGSNVYQDSNEFQASHPRDKIKSVYFSEGWLPFSTDGLGNYLALDINPEKHGKIGQIINCGRDQNDKFVIAESLQEFLTMILQIYLSGNLRLSLMQGESKIVLAKNEREEEVDPFYALTNKI